jgi:hypothetical protein
METLFHLLFSYFQLFFLATFVKHGRHKYYHTPGQRLPSQLDQATKLIQVRQRNSFSNRKQKYKHHVCPRYRLASVIPISMDY